jgi:hypothetical protein
LRAFIERHLTTAAQVDVLLLLHRERQAWAAAAVAKELRIDAHQAEHLMVLLAKAGLLQKDDDVFRYAPRTAALAARVDDLAEQFPAFRVAIISLIFAKPGASLRSFSDAFRIRDED